MKNLIAILFVLVAVGYGKTEVKKLSGVERLETETKQIEAENKKHKEELIRFNHEQVQ